MLLSATVSNSDKKAGDLPVGEEYKGNGSSCPLSKRSIGEERRGEVQACAIGMIETAP